VSIRCAMYARYSTDKQNPASIEDQLYRCEQYARERGWTVLQNHIYSDAEVTGATLERPGLVRLLATAESPSRPIDAILCEDTSRLSRKLADVLNLSERLTFEGVRICFVAQGIDSSENQFQLLVSARGMIDQLFLADTSARVHRGMEGLVRKGLHTGGRCYGYRSEKAGQDGSVRLVVDEIEASVVRRIFDMFASGHSLKQIARKLNAESVPSPQPQLGRIQRSWAPSAIRQILLNEKYIGNVVWNRRKKVRNPKTGKRVFRARPESEWMRNDVPELRIVSDEQWNGVERRFEYVRSHFGPNTKVGLIPHWSRVSSPYLFSGILRCAECGASMNIVSGTGKRAYSRYGCPMHALRGTCANGLTERSDIIEDRLLQKLQEAVLRPEVVEYALGRFANELRKQMESIDNDQEMLNERKRVLEGEIQQFTAALLGAAGAPTPKAIIAAINQREAELDRISSRKLESSSDFFQAKLRDARDFVTSRLGDLRKLLSSDVATAKAELLKHVQRIDLTPMGAAGERFYLAEGEWDLLGGFCSRKAVGAAGRS